MTGSKRPIRRSFLVGLAGALAGCTGSPGRDPLRTKETGTYTAPGEGVVGWTVVRGECGEMYENPLTVRFEAEDGRDISLTTTFGEKFSPDLKRGAEYNITVVDGDGTREPIGKYTHYGENKTIIVSGCTV